MKDNNDLKQLVDKRIKNILEVDTNKIDDNDFKKLVEQAKIGMIYMRDQEISKRINSGQQIRVINLISSDIDERSKYISVSLPEYMPRISSVC